MPGVQNQHTQFHIPTDSTLKETSDDCGIADGTTAVCCWHCADPHSLWTLQALHVLPGQGMRQQPYSPEMNPPPMGLHMPQHGLANQDKVALNFLHSHETATATSGTCNAHMHKH